MINFCSCALPASRQRYLNSGCPENVKNVAKTVNRSLRRILDPNFPASSPLLLLPQLIFSISISLEQKFSFLYHYSYPLFSSSPRSIFFFFHSRINISNSTFFLFYPYSNPRFIYIYIYTLYFFRNETNKTLSRIPPLISTPPLPRSNEWKKSGLDAEIDRNEGLRRDKGQEGRQRVEGGGWLAA